MKKRKTRIVVFLVTLGMLCSMGINVLADCPDCGYFMLYGGCSDMPYTSIYYSACPRYPSACVVYRDYFGTVYICQSCGIPDYFFQIHLHRYSHDTCAHPDNVVCSLY